MVYGTDKSPDVGTIEYNYSRRQVDEVTIASRVVACLLIVCEMTSCLF
jgi:hypothetical protein